jgi:hypothetical protein
MPSPSLVARWLLWLGSLNLIVWRGSRSPGTRSKGGYWSHNGSGGSGTSQSQALLVVVWFDANVSFGANGVMVFPPHTSSHILKRGHFSSCLSRRVVPSRVVLAPI